MKLSLSWLEEFLPHVPPTQQLAQLLTDLGVEVEGEEKFGSDTILHLALTPNLGHAMGVRGLAREIAAATSQLIKLKRPSSLTGAASSRFTIQIADATLCPRYSCCEVVGVKVGPSPRWLKGRLEASGLRSINNVVDAANYIMWELGQPMHTFDAERLTGQQIGVRASDKVEKLTTLDSVTRELPAGTLLIWDEKSPIALAGVMGGLESSVSERTTHLLLESAQFDPSAVRRTMRGLGLRTDSGARFERGIDPLGVEEALLRLAALIVEVAGGKASQVVSKQMVPYQPIEITLRPKRLNQLLGTSLSSGEVNGLLSRLGMKVIEGSDEKLLVTPPSFRSDIKIEIDLVEEVARLYGYNNLPLSTAPHRTGTLPHAGAYDLENRVRWRMIASGMQEWITCDLISPSEASSLLGHGLKESNLIHVLHPSSIDQSVLRTSLLPGMLASLRHNLDRSIKDLAAFEVGKIHFRQREDQGEQFLETTMLACLLTGESSPDMLRSEAREVDLLDLKGIIEQLLHFFHLESFSFQPSDHPLLHPHRQVELRAGEFALGVLGELHPESLRAARIDKRVYFAELSLKELQRARKKECRVQPLSSHPASERDVTLTLPQERPYGELVKRLEKERFPLLERAWLLDLYEGGKVPQGMRNITLRLRYRHPERTLSFEEVEEQHAAVLSFLRALL